jgi:hypothetical protein
MRIITLSCPDCGTIIAGNVLEKTREMKCPGLSCERVIQFSNLADTEREHILLNRDKYEVD